MVKRSLLLLAFGIVLIIIVASFLFFQQKNSSSSQNYLVPTPTMVVDYQGSLGGDHSISESLPTTSLQEATNPQDIVKAFYSWYLSSPQNPVTSGAYQHNKYLSSQFKDQITSLASNNRSYDPVLCNQNKSQNFTVGEPAYNDLGNQSKVIVSANIPHGKDLYRFVLNYSGGKWLITDIICIP